jgi:1-acyl-sn-glycerol-3-phosphate acyltransferase
MLPSASLRSVSSNGGMTVYFVLDALTAVLFSLFRFLYKVRIEGLENLPPHGPYILSSNEISEMGSVMTSVVVARLILRGKVANPVGFADEYNWTQMWKAVYDRGGARPVLPHGRGQGTWMLLEALRALREGRVVVLNPEGEMSWDGRMVRLRPAVAWLALRSGVPVVPMVSTKGAYDVWPKWAKRPHLTGHFQVRLGKPLFLSTEPCSRVSDEMIQQGMQRLKEEMMCLIYR